MSGSRERRPGRSGEGFGPAPNAAGPLLDPGGYGAQYRELAGNLRSLDPGGGSPGSVVVTGAGRGVGCSSICLGLGGALVSMGLRAAVVDCNFGRPGLHKMLGEPNFTGLSTALEARDEPEACGYEALPGLLVMPTGPVPEDPSGLESGGLAGVVDGLRKGRDVVLLDAPRSREVQASVALSEGFDGVLLVIHASRTARSVAREAADGLVDAGANLLGVVLNGRP